MLRAPGNEVWQGIALSTCSGGSGEEEEGSSPCPRAGAAEPSQVGDVGREGMDGDAHRAQAQPKEAETPPGAGPGVEQCLLSEWGELFPKSPVRGWDWPEGSGEQGWDAAGVPAALGRQQPASARPNSWFCSFQQATFLKLVPHPGGPARSILGRAVPGHGAGRRDKERSWSSLCLRGSSGMEMP